MAYNLELAERMRELLAGQQQFVEKRMFGGVGFLHQGNMCCGAWKEFVILRIGLDAYPAALRQPGVRKFDITGRVMKGWVMVEQTAVEDYDELWEWMQKAIRFVHALPAKKQ